MGGGVAGLTAAHLLGPLHDVTLFEQEDRAGGHTHTVTVPDGPDAGTPIDTGFIVFNDRNYPTFRRLLARLGVKIQDSDMSFSYHRVRDGFHYAGTSLDGLFSRRANLVSPRFLGMLGDLARFNRTARRDLEAGAFGERTLGEYVRDLGLGAGLTDWYLAPMAAAIWSTPADEVMAYPAQSFARFFDNHGLLKFTGAPQWQTVVGGSHNYVRALLAAFPGNVRLGAKVRSIARGPAGVRLATSDGESAEFDRAVVATHADQALALLDDPTPDERRLLGAWRYTVNHAVLHSDASVLPPARRAWASWNYEEDPGSRAVCVTYAMNRLQRLRARETWCVTLNRSRAVDPRRVVREMTYTHPYYDRAAIASQAGLPGLNGARHTYYCGSYFGWGFHEDAVASAAQVGRAFGAAL